jgi:hypothetical protein
MAFELKNYKFLAGTHREKNVIWVQFNVWAGSNVANPHNVSAGVRPA